MSGTNTSNQFTVNNVLNMFGKNITRAGLIKMENEGKIPKAKRGARGKSSTFRYWELSDLPQIGEKLGFFKKPKEQKIVTFYTQKGGTGKTPLAFNFARTLSLHNLKTLVIGLDSQETITSLLGARAELEQLPDDLDDLYNDGLYECLKGDKKIDEVIKSTELNDLLHYIPENAGLAAFESLISSHPNPLLAMKKILQSKSLSKYDYIVFDCNPAWNRTVNSVLYISDIILSPLACNSSTLKISRVFFNMLNEFEEDGHTDAQKFIIPTLLKSSKLSRQVRTVYETQYSDICSRTALKESVVFDEAQQIHKSIAEYSPTSATYADLIQVFIEFQKLVEFIDDDDVSIEDKVTSESSDNLARR